MAMGPGWSKSVFLMSLCGHARPTTNFEPGHVKKQGAGSRLLLAFFVCAAALFLCAPLSHAQTAATGAITSTVTDPSGGAVANTTVTATNKGTNQEREAKTAADGVYKFSFLNPGDYRLRFSAAGFKSSEVES